MTYVRSLTVYYRSVTCTNLQPHENSFREFSQCSETHSWSHMSFTLMHFDTHGYVCLMVHVQSGAILTRSNISCRALTHWGRVTHICIGNLTTIGSDNGLSPGRRQAIIWTNAGMLLIGPLWTNFSEILSEIPTFSFKKMRLKVSSAKRRPFCLGLNVLKWQLQIINLALNSQKTYNNSP